MFESFGRWLDRMVRDGPDSAPYGIRVEKVALLKVFLAVLWLSTVNPYAP
jgi:hypothetical protein